MTLLRHSHSAPFPFEGEAAFTLVEMLIAIAIAAIVLTAINTLFFGALRLRARATEAAEMMLPIDHAVATMKRDLLSVLPPGVIAGAMGSDAVAIGITQQPLLEIFTASGSITTEAPWSDVQKIDYFLQSPTNRTSLPGQNLIRGVTRNLLSTTTETPDQQTLLEGVQTLQFSYYDGTNWNDTWSTTLSNLPTAIKVSVDFATGRSDTQMKPPIRLLIPIVTWDSTNSITNQLSN